MRLIGAALLLATGCRQQPPDPPPFHLFYTVHAHLQGDALPYTAEPVVDAPIDAEIGANMVAIVEGIQGVVEAHGLPVTWQPTYGGARGLCALAEARGVENPWAALVAGGHEVGVHAHAGALIATTAEDLRTFCDVEPVTVSGQLVEVMAAEDTHAQAILSGALAEAAAAGIAVATENLAPDPGRNPLGDQCASFGSGNSMWPETGNLMFPWRPAYMEEDICGEDAGGDVILVDHAGPAWLETGTGTDAGSVIGDTDFAELEVLLQGAVDWMATERPERQASWGFVTHIIEFTTDPRGGAGPDSGALEALDRFLDLTDRLRDEGRLVYGTAGAIAETAGEGG